MDFLLGFAGRLLVKEDGFVVWADGAWRGDLVVTEEVFLWGDGEADAVLVHEIVLHYALIVLSIVKASIDLSHGFRLFNLIFIITGIGHLPELLPQLLCVLPVLLSHQD